MSAADVLEAVRAAGVSLAVDGPDLALKSFGPPAPDVLDLVRVHKAEIIAALTVANPANQEPDDIGVDWSGWYEERAAIRQFDGGHTREEAERLAWGEVEDRWHRAHGERVPRDVCAGCRRPIGSAVALDLADGNRVHHDHANMCLTQHGDRWRAVATRALAAMGLRSPATPTGSTC
jgi:hypothetical protein